MTETFKKLVQNQLEAALSTLRLCVEACPPEEWDCRLQDEVFCQAAFHAVFYADYYLGRDEAALKDQDFHRENETVFGDYEELEDRQPVLLYEKAFIFAYIGHCRSKIPAALAAEDEASLKGPTGFGRRSYPRAELYINNIRHVQHHAAQLSMRLAMAGGDFVPWVGSGWRL